MISSNLRLDLPIVFYLLLRRVTLRDLERISDWSVGHFDQQRWASRRELDFTVEAERRVDFVKKMFE